MSKHHLVGRKGEVIAQKYLRELGYEILGKNVQTGAGEIDLICKKDDVIVFVEVKARAKNDGFRAVDRVDGKKIERLKRAGEVWLADQREEMSARIDVIGVCEDKIVEHFEGVG